VIREAFRICATCRHFEVLEEGVEFPGIADTEFIRFRCRLLGLVGREDYLMEPVEKCLPADGGATCPHWEGH